MNGSRPANRFARYYGIEAWRRLRHYGVTRVRGYPDRGDPTAAARRILAERATSGATAGGHFEGVWPRDLCFAARGFRVAGYDDSLREAGDRLTHVLESADVFYTDVHGTYAAATPAEGVDTFPALVVLLAEVEALETSAEPISALAERHRERFFDDERAIVTGSGSSWWDSAAAPRETYNTAMLLAAVERLDALGVETTYAGCAQPIRDGLLTHLWTGTHFAEHRDSSVLACDANVVPLYFDLIDGDRTRSIVNALDRLETPNGLCMRERPFSRREVHPFFVYHRDYHYHVWPWNSLMYANATYRDGFRRRAARERERVEATCREHGTFLEVVSLSGRPYARLGYASAGDFTVAAALWLELADRRGSLELIEPNRQENTGRRET
ncbi:hypothetical protein [Halovivax gelatinilyticus]|uniref:hypothetical protein n=1 Tax=Halovivax gelatinilyticus TaxID=2961597 RepID=UPI0020CA7260|nr:hypothetical protein [Halovivax gelatinilyticus]